MKKKCLIALLSLSCALVSAAGLAACNLSPDNSNGGDNAAHTHAWSQEWQNNQTHHWHECTASDCTVTDNSRKDGYAEHDFTDGNCICGQAAPQLHTHTYSVDWSKNNTHHWHAAVCEHTDEKSDYAEHDFSDGSCICGEVAPHSHVLNEISESAASCTEDGNIAYWNCQGCEKYFSDKNATNEITVEDTVIIKLGHDTEQHGAQAATCTETGWNAYETCTRCDYSTYNEIAALNHDLEQHGAQAATCTEIGWNAYETCTRCDYSTYSEIAALNHDTEQHNAQAATCTETGWDAYETCTRCDYSTYNEIAALGHNYSFVPFDENKHSYKCSQCDNIEKQEEHQFTGKQCSICNFITEDSLGLKYILEDDHYILSGMGTCNDSKLVIPSTHQGLPVTSVAGYAFNRKSSLTEIVFPSTITTISDFAFVNCNNIKRIVFNGDVETISNSAFGNCFSLTEAYFRTGNEKQIPVQIGRSSTFYGKDMVLVTGDGTRSYQSISRNLYTHTGESDYSYTTVTDDGFIFVKKSYDSKPVLIGYNGSYGRELILPDGFNGQHYDVTSCAFYFENVTLDKLVIPDAVDSIGSFAFFGYGANVKSLWISNPSNVGMASLSSLNAKIIKSNYASQKIKNTDTFYKVCADTVEIGCWSGSHLYGGIYSGLTCLKNVVITEGTARIDTSAFSDCTELTSITIPDSVTYIGDSAFNNCNKLQYNEYENGYYAGNDNNPYLVLIKAKDQNVTSFTIHENTKLIYDSPFANCSNLTNITIPNNIIYISNEALIGNKLQYNEYDNAYYLGNDDNPYLVLIKTKDKNITSCAIHNNTKFIYSKAFYNCKNLIDLTIGNGVTSIGYYAFFNCSGLTDITFNGTIEQWKAIKKDYWNSFTVDYTVHCTDGDLSKA